MSETPISWQEWVDELSLKLQEMHDAGEYKDGLEYALAELPDSEYGGGDGPHMGGGQSGDP